MIIMKETRVVKLVFILSIFCAYMAPQYLFRVVFHKVFLCCVGKLAYFWILSHLITHFDKNYGKISPTLQKHIKTKVFVLLCCMAKWYCEVLFRNHISWRCASQETVCYLCNKTHLQNNSLILIISLWPFYSNIAYYFWHCCKCWHSSYHFGEANIW